VALVFAVWALRLVGCNPRPDAEATFLADLNPVGRLQASPPSRCG
jgi:hypothetical protein